MHNMLIISMLHGFLKIALGGAIRKMLIIKYLTNFEIAIPKTSVQIGHTLFCLYVCKISFIELKFKVGSTLFAKVRKINETFVKI